MSCEDCDKLPRWSPRHPLPRIDYHHAFAGAIMAIEDNSDFSIPVAVTLLQRGL